MAGNGGRRDMAAEHDQPTHCRLRGSLVSSCQRGLKLLSTRYAIASTPRTSIPIAQPQLGPEEEAAVLEVMRSGTFAMADRTRAFEQRFAMTMGAAHGVATCSGTAALQLALLAHGIGPGDEVITSPLTLTGTADAISYAGATPIFADVDSSLNLSSSEAARLIGPRTKAIVLVHLHGNPGDLPSFWHLAKERGLVLIQDACQAVGATIDGEPLGVFGTAVYSSYAAKNITTGEGGIIITNDPQVARTAARLRHQSYSDQPYVREAIGNNFQMTEMQAAIGTVQLRKLEAITERRRQIAAFYDRNVSRWYIRPSVAPGRRHVYHQYVLRVPRGWSRDDVRLNLRSSGVATGVHYPLPLHLQPPYMALGNPPCPEAERAATEIFSVPVHPGLSDDDCTAVASQLNRIVDSALPL
jgi:dTDP-4-amino-4,6-dideoxygalactose transaminase